MIESHKEAREAFAIIEKLEARIWADDISYESIECIHVMMNDIANDIEQFADRTIPKLVVDNVKSSEA